MQLAGCYRCSDSVSGCADTYQYRYDPWMDTSSPVYYNDINDGFSDDNDDDDDSLPNQNDQSHQHVLENSLPNQNDQPLRRID